MNQDNPPETAARPHPLIFSSVKDRLWSTTVRIRFGNCDPAGIVYTPKFFDIFNVVIEEWYERALHIDYYELIGKRRIGLGYVNAHSDFFSPCLMGDTLAMAVKIERIGNSSFVVLIHAFNGESEALRGRFTVVVTDLDTHRPQSIPDDLRSALLDYANS